MIEFMKSLRPFGSMPRKILLSGKEFGGSHAAEALPFGAVSSQLRQQRRNPRLDTRAL